MDNNSSELLVRCTKCLRELSRDSFHRNKGKSSGLESSCKECVSTAKSLSAKLKRDHSRRSSAARIRRNGCKTLDISLQIIQESYVEVDTEHVRDVVEDFLGKLLCLNEKWSTLPLAQRRSE